jgi:predicted nucleic acid-binding protein
MKLVVDANVVISALIADSKTRELIVTLEPELLTPEVVHVEIGNGAGTSPPIYRPLVPVYRDGARQ